MDAPSEVSDGTIAGRKKRRPEGIIGESSGGEPTRSHLPIRCHETAFRLHGRDERQERPQVEPSCPPHTRTLRLMFLRCVCTVSGDIPRAARDFLGAVPRPDKTADIEFRKRQSGHPLLSAVRASSRLPQHTAYLILYKRGMAVSCGFIRDVHQPGQSGSPESFAGKRQVPLWTDRVRPPHCSERCAA